MKSPEPSGDFYLYKMKKAVKNIIFDLGGVILNIDYNKPREAFHQLGISAEDSFYSKQQQVSLFDDLETGRISGNDFLNELKKQAHESVTTEQLRDAWNSILLDFPLRRLQILQQLQLHYNLYLLSNTNEIHEEAFNDLLFRTCGYPNLGVFFDKVYLSHRVGMRKPQPEIFELVLQGNNLLAEETLFIDDSIQHIHSAEQLHIQCIHLASPMTIEEIFLPKA